MKYRLLLLLAALIWGFAFVAQVIGMDSIGPYAFNGIRFLLGSLSLLPIIYYYPSGYLLLSFWQKSERSFLFHLGCHSYGGYTSLRRRHSSAGRPSIHHGIKNKFPYCHLPAHGAGHRSFLRAGTAPEPYLRCHSCHGGGLLYFHHGNTRYRIWRFLSASLCRLLRSPYHSPQLSDAAFPACHTLIRTIHGRRYMQPYSGLLL